MADQRALNQWDGVESVVADGGWQIGGLMISFTNGLIRSCTFGGLVNLAD